MQIQLAIVTSLMTMSTFHFVMGENDRKYMGDFQVSDYDFMNEVLKFITYDKSNEDNLIMGDDTSNEPVSNRPGSRSPTKHRNANLQIGNPYATSSVTSNDQANTEKHANKPSTIEDGHMTTSLPNIKSDIKTYPKPTKEGTKQSLGNKALESKQKYYLDNQSHFNVSIANSHHQNKGKAKKLLLLSDQMVSKVNDEFHNLFTDKAHKLFKTQHPRPESEYFNSKPLQSDDENLGNSTSKGSDVHAESPQPSYTYIRNDYMFDHPQASDATKHLLSTSVGITCALLFISVYI